MIVKINYKLEMSFYDQLVVYHVGFGIGMAVVGFFHFWWHLSYYLHLFKAEKTKASRRAILAENDLGLRHLEISAFLLGSTSIIAQIILLREFLTIFNGNELVIALVLANWMVLTGLGAYLGKFPIRIKKASLIIIPGLLILSVLPFVTTLLLNFLKNIVFPIGAMISVFQIFFASLLLLIPFCLVSGFLFTFISDCYSGIRNQNETGRVYSYESAGSIVGGMLSGLLFIFVFSSVESLLVLTLLNGLTLFLVNLKRNMMKLDWLSMVVVVPAFALLFFHPEKKIRSWVYPNQNIEVSKDSPQGNIVITRRENMWSVYINNMLLFDSENFMMNEETVHFTMLQHLHPANVLLVSAGLSGQISELTKYNPVSIDYVEDNQWLLTLMKDTLGKMMDSSIRVYATDPLLFIRKATKTYDVVILNLPGPSTLQTNRFYTLEFFALLKEKLSRGAVISFGLQAPANYMNNEAIDLNSTIFVTLKKVFQNVIIIPGEKNYFLASDAPLTYNIAQAVQDQKIENRYVNQFYIDDSSLKNRGETILSALNTETETNQNLKPVLYNLQLAYWLSYFKGNYRITAILAAALALFVFFRGNSPSRVMFLTGFSASGLEILLLFGLQIFYGNIYLLTSFVFTAFMIGLAVGSFFGKSLKKPTGKKYIPFTQILIGVFAAGIIVLLFSTKMYELIPAIVYSFYLAATFLIGGLTGFQFTLVSLKQKGSYAEIAGRTYSYDLFGSALGALVIALYLVPETGIIASGLTIGLVNLVFGFFLILKK